MNAIYKQDQLLYLDLPLFVGVPPSRVLVLVVAQDEQSCTVLIEDDGRAPVTRQLLGREIPAIYNAQPFGSMREMFARHAGTAVAIFEAGNLVTSNLTSARALTMMLNDASLSVHQALSSAKEIGQACAAMVIRQSGLVANLA